MWQKHYIQFFFEKHGFFKIGTRTRATAKSFSYEGQEQGIFRFIAEAGSGKVLAAVTEDRATLGSDPSAGDGSKLAGVSLLSMVRHSSR